MNDINEVLNFLDTLRNNLSNYSLEELEDIANACQDICDDVDLLL